MSRVGRCGLGWGLRAMRVQLFGSRILRTARRLRPAKSAGPRPTPHLAPPKLPAGAPPPCRAADYCAQHGVGGEEVAALIRQRVQAETSLTCSGGLAGIQ